jgi:hypothetical protein
MIRTAILAVAALLALSLNAEARQRHRAVVADPGCNVIFPCEGVAPSPRGERIVKSMGGFGSAQKVYMPRSDARVSTGHREEAIVAHPSGCPARAFCGCGAAVRVFGSPIRSLWLAANWFKFPRAAPAPGMAAVRAHHVFVLEAYLGGNTWTVYDANSGGHQTRIHARSIAGYVIVNPRGGAA